MKWWSQPPVFASVRSNAVLSHRCLLPGHQPVRWRLSLLPSSSRTPGLLVRRANGARDSIRLCAAMETTSSTHSKNRRSGSTQHSGVCLEVGDLPEAGRRRRDKVHTHNDGESFWPEKGDYSSLPAHPTGAPPTGGLGPGPDMEAARDLTALACGVPERGPGAELERSRRGPRFCPESPKPTGTPPEIWGRDVIRLDAPYTAPGWLKRKRAPVSDLEKEERPFPIVPSRTNSQPPRQSTQVPWPKASCLFSHFEQFCILLCWRAGLQIPWRDRPSSSLLEPAPEWLQS